MGLGVSVLAFLVSVGCTASSGMAAMNLLSQPAITKLMKRSKETIAPTPANPGGVADGNAQGVCPTECRAVKAAMGKYFEDFSTFATIVLAVLAAQILLHLIIAICTLIPHALAIYAHMLLTSDCWSK